MTEQEAIKLGIYRVPDRILAEEWVPRFTALYGSKKKAEQLVYDTIRKMADSNQRTSQINLQLSYTWDRTSAKQSNERDAKQRLNAIRQFTEPDMVGFFPAYDPNARHSKFAYGYGDTETADDNRQIIEIAGLKVIWNKDAKRFEQLEKGGIENQFYRVYNPKGARYVQTENVHGKNPSILAAIRSKLKAGYSESWNSRENETYNNWLGKDTIEGGHNWLAADASWKEGLVTGDFARYREPSYKRGILDSLHLTSALFGKGKPEEKRNALQNLARRFNISAESLGIPAHAGWADTVLGLKVVEKVLQQFGDTPAAQEFIAAMDTGNVHSHYWESNPDLLHGSSYLTHTVSGKALSKPVAALYNDLSTKEKAEALEISYSDLIEGKVSLSDYEEMEMADVDASLREDMKSIAAYISKNRRLYGDEAVNISSPGDAQSWNNYILKNAVTAIKSELLRTDVNTSAWLDASKTAEVLKNENIHNAVVQAIRMNKLGNEDVKDVDSLGFRMTARALAELDFARQKELAKEDRKVEHRLNRDRALYADTDFYQSLQARDLDSDTYDAELKRFRQQQKHEAKIKQDQRRVEKKRDLILKKDAQFEGTPFYTNLIGATSQDELDDYAIAKSEYKQQQRQLAAQAKAQQKQEAQELKDANLVNRIRAKYVRPEAKMQDIKDELAQQKLDRQQSLQDFHNEALTYQQELNRESIGSKLESKFKQRAYLQDAKGLTGAQYKKFASLVDEGTLSFEEYKSAVDGAIKSNQKITGTIKAMSEAGAKFYNPGNYWQAQVYGWNEVGSAVTGLLPRPFREAGDRFTTAGSQFMQAAIAQKQYMFNQASNIGNILIAGGRSVFGANPIVGGVMSGLGGAINLGSNLIGGKMTADMQTQTKLFAGRINLLSAGFSALLAPLRLFHSGLRGFIGLWSKLSSIMSIRYGIPYSDLTGISSTHYSAMLDSDSAFGLRAGTVNAMHNNMAYAQAGLYTSGQYDKQRLIAAARMGVFGSVYAPMGGSTEQQMSQTIDSLANRMAGADTRTKQETLYFAQQIDPSMPEILERLALFKETGKYRGSFDAFQSGKAFSRVWQRHMSKQENADWEWASSEFSAGRHQFDMALKRFATPLWNSLGLPLVNAVNETLNKLPSVITADGIDWNQVKQIGKDFWKKVTKTLGIEGKSPDTLFKSAVAKVEEFLGSSLGVALQNGILAAIEFIKDKETWLLDAIAPSIQRIKDYINDIDFDIKMENGHIKLNLMTPEEKQAENVKFLRQASRGLSTSYPIPMPGAPNTVKYNDYTKARENIDTLRAYGIEVEGLDLSNWRNIPDDMLKELTNSAALVKSMPYPSKRQAQDMLKKYDKATHLKYDTSIDDTVKSLIDAGKKTLNMSSKALNDLVGSSTLNIKITDETGKIASSIEKQIDKSVARRYGVSVHGNEITFRNIAVNE